MSIRNRLDKLERVDGPAVCPSCGGPLPASVPATRDNFPAGATFAPIDLDAQAAEPSPCSACGRPPQFHPITLEGDKQLPGDGSIDE